MDSPGNLVAGIGGQLKGEVGKIAKDVVGGLKQAGKDAMGEAVESVVGGSGKQMVTAGSGGLREQGISAGVDPDVIRQQEKKQAETRRLRQLQDELEAYRQRKKAEEDQEEKVEEEEKKMNLEQKESEKQKRTKDLISRVQKAYGGTGEGSKMVG